MAYGWVIESYPPPPLTQQECHSISSLCAAGRGMPLLVGVAAF
jgi:hypothetical protein